MGLTVYYDWKIKIDLPAARRMIAKFRAVAIKLPFDDVSEIYYRTRPEKLEREYTVIRMWNVELPK